MLRRDMLGELCDKIACTTGIPSLRPVTLKSFMFSLKYSLYFVL